jgi:hypothetical protein
VETRSRAEMASAAREVTVTTMNPVRRGVTSSPKYAERRSLSEEQLQAHTLEVITPLTKHQATALDKQIRERADQVAQDICAIKELLDQAQAEQVHLTLGWKSWPAYVADVLSGRLDVTENNRKSIVRVLRGEGLSLRAIGTATNTSKSSVQRELSQDGTVDQPATVTSLDGKKRPAKQPPAPPPAESGSTAWVIARDIITPSGDKDTTYWDDAVNRWCPLDTHPGTWETKARAEWAWEQACGRMPRGTRVVKRRVGVTQVEAERLSDNEVEPEPLTVEPEPLTVNEVAVTTLPPDSHTTDEWQLAEAESRINAASAELGKAAECLIGRTASHNVARAMENHIAKAELLHSKICGGSIDDELLALLDGDK